MVAIQITPEHSFNLCREATAAYSAWVSITRAIQPGKLAQVLHERVQNGHLTFSGFHQALPSLVPRKSLSDSHRKQFSLLLQKLFAAFDPQDKKSVPYKEFYAGFLTFCAGSAADKLDAAWRVCDEHSSGELSRVQLQAMFRGFITALKVVSLPPMSAELPDIQNEVNSLAADCVASAFAATNSSMLLSHAGLSRWLASDGKKQCPWVQAIDVDTWAAQAAPRAPPVPAASSSRSRSPAPQQPALPTSQPTQPSENSALIAFQLVQKDDDWVQLVVSEEAVAAYVQLLRCSKLHSVPASVAVRAVLDCGMHEGVHRAGYDSILRDIVPAAQLDREERRALTKALRALFYAVASALDSQTVPLPAVAALVSLPAAGSKSDKLAATWTVFAAEGGADADLSLNDLGEFLQAWLLAIAAVCTCEDVPMLGMDQCREASEVLLEHVANYADVSEDGCISFDAFADWYNDGGVQLAPWLELLDNRKWPVLRDEQDQLAEAVAPRYPVSSPPRDVPAALAATADEAVTAGSTDGSDHEHEEEAAGQQGAEDVLYKFSLAPYKVDFTLHTAAQQDIVDVCIDTGLYASADCGTLVDLLTLDEPLEAGQFIALANALTGSPLSVSAQDVLLYVHSWLSRVANADVDADQQEEEEAALLPCDAAVALSMFVQGDKSEKLLFGFSVYDSSHTGSLSSFELWQFLRCVLCTLAALEHASSGDIPVPAGVLRAAAASAAEAVLEQATTTVDEHGEPAVSYDAFGEWYNAGGFEAVGWLELLNPTKWSPAMAQVLAEVASTRAQGVRGAQLDADMPAFDFGLCLAPGGDTEQPAMLHFTVGDCARFGRQLGLSGLLEVTAQDMVSVVRAAASGGSSQSMVSASAFQNMVRQIIGGRLDVCQPEDTLFLSRAMMQVYGLVRRSEDGGVCAPELATALMVQCAGRKSEKLAAAWDALAGEDASSSSADEPTMSKMGLWRMLRAFLLGLLAIKFSDVPLGDAQMQALRDEVEQVAVFIAEAVMGSDSSPDDQLAFDTFGEWYNSGGYTAAPWLELLDVSKWPSVLGAVMAAHHTATVLSEQQQQPAQNDGQEEAPAGDSLAVHVLSDEVAAREFGAQQLRFPLAQVDDLPIDLVIRESDIRNVCRLLTCCETRALTCQGLYEAVAERAAEDGTIDKDTWSDVLSDRVLLEGLSEADAAFAALTGATMYYMFEVEEDMPVPASFLALALGVLALGSKSEKLSDLWSIYAEPADSGSVEDQVMDIQSLQLFLETLLLAMLSLSQQSSHSDPAITRAAANGSTTAAARALVVVTQATDISFAQFAEWYNGEGCTVLPWLELLGLHKWGPQVQATCEALQEDDLQVAPGDLPPMTGPADGPRADPEAQAVFAFDLGVAGPGLRLSAANTRAVLQMAELTGLQYQSAKHIAEAVLSFADGQLLYGEALDDLLEQLVPKASLPASERDQLYNMLQRMFVLHTDASDAQSTHLSSASVPAADYALALSLLAGGAKSGKLAVLWQLYERSNEAQFPKRGVLSAHSLLKLMTSLILSLSMFSSAHSHLLPLQRQRLATHGAARAVRCVLHWAAAEDRLVVVESPAKSEPADESAMFVFGNVQGVHFEDFGAWYNSEGYTYAAWLELLDLSKWRVGPSASVTAQADDGNDSGFDDEDNVTAAAASAGPTLSSMVESVEEDTQTDLEAMAASGAVFSFALPGSPDGLTTIALTTEDVHMLSRLAEVSRLCQTAPEAVYEVFEHASHDGKLSLADFSAAMHQLMRDGRDPDEDSKFARTMLVNLFHAFDTNGDDFVDAAEVAAGFSVLGSGSKSEKLALAFSLMDADADGYLRHGELTSYLRGFLRMLAALARTRHPGTLDGMHHAVDAAASHIAREVFAQADLDHDDRLSFEEFGAWYNRGGYQLAPWLELLDLSKWPGLEQLVENVEASATAMPSAASDVRMASPPKRAADAESSSGAADQDANNSNNDSRSSSSNFKSGTLLHYELYDWVQYDSAAADDDAYVLEFDEKQLGLYGSALATSQLPRLSAANLQAAVASLLQNEGDTSISPELFEELVLLLADRAGGGSVVEGAVRGVVLPILQALAVTTPSMQEDESGDETQPGVDAAEVLVALLPLVAGSKSDKLAMGWKAMAWGIFPDDALQASHGDDPKLDEAGLWRFLTSLVLSLLCAQRSLGAHRGSDLSAELCLAVSSAVEGVAGALFSEADLPAASTPELALLSFDTFAAMYSTQYYTRLGWLELTAWQKWPWPAAVSHVLASLPTPGRSSVRASGTPPRRTARVAVERATAAVSGPAPLDDDGVIFEFPVADSVLPFTVSDCKHAQEVTLLSGLGYTPASDAVPAVLDVVASASAAPAEADEVSMRTFRHVIRHLVPGEALTDENKVYLSVRLSQVYEAFQAAAAAAPGTDGSLPVTLAELVSALTIFFNGNKSSKMALAWGLFARDAELAQGVLDSGSIAGVQDDGKYSLEAAAASVQLGRVQLWRLVRALLLGVASLSAAWRASDVSARMAELDRHSLAVADAVLAVDGQYDSAKFDDLGEWYNAAGYEQAAWLELLDLRKWPQVLLDDEDQADAEFDGSSAGTSSDDDDLDAEDLVDVVDDSAWLDEQSSAAEEEDADTYEDDCESGTESEVEPYRAHAALHSPAHMVLHGDEDDASVDSAVDASAALADLSASSEAAR